MSSTTRYGAHAASAGPGAGVEVGPAPGGARGRRAPGRLLVVAGAVVAAVLVLVTALTLLALLVRQEDAVRASYAGVGAVRVGASCAGDARVVADPSMAPGTAEATWSERWTLRRPSHDGAVRGGTLDVGTTCSRFTVGLSSTSDVSVRVPPGLEVALEGDVGDVVVSGIDAGVRVSTGVGGVRVDGAGGRVDVDTGAGDVAVDGALDGVRVDSGVGDVRVSSTTAPQLVDVDAGVGDVTVRVPGQDAYAVNVDAGVGESSVDVPQDAGSPRRVQVDAGVGDVVVETAR